MWNIVNVVITDKIKCTNIESISVKSKTIDANDILNIVISLRSWIINRHRIEF